MSRREKLRRRKGTAAGIATLLFFFFAMCIDGMMEIYSIGKVIAISMIAMAIVGACVWYSNLPEGRG